MYIHFLIHKANVIQNLIDNKEHESIIKMDEKFIQTIV